MEFLYNGNSLKAGVYKITNKLNGRIYIGSTYQFKRRWQQHRKQLELNIHLNKFLQNDFNKCGTDNFVLEVLDIIDSGKEDRLFVEQIYLDYYFDFMNQCYNLTKFSIATRENKPATENTKEILSFKSKERWKIPEFREKMIKSMKDFHKSEKAISLKENQCKSWEEKFGYEKSQEMKKTHKDMLKNKTYEEIYGIEKAKEIKLKQAQSKIGKIASIETRLKQSRVRKGKNTGKNNPFYGKKHTDEQRQKWSEQRKKSK